MKPRDHFQYIQENPEKAPLFWGRLEYMIQFWTGRTKELLRSLVPPAQLYDIENDVMNIFVHTASIVARLYNGKTPLNFYTHYKLKKETYSYAKCLRTAKLKKEFQSYDAIKPEKEGDCKHWEPETPNQESFQNLLMDLEGFLIKVPYSAKKIYSLRIKGYSVSDIMHELNLSENSVRYQLRKAFENISY